MATANLFSTTAYIIGSFTTAVLSTIPAAWFILHGQSAPGALGVWVTIANLVHGINSLVWKEDVVNRAPLWCDISSQIILIYSTGTICSCLCMAKFLAYALSSGAANLSYEVRRAVNIRNYIFCFGFPMAMIPFHYLYSPNRFGLVRTMGCEASYVLTWPAFMCFIIWAPIFGTIAFSYTVFVATRLFQLKRHRREARKYCKIPTQRLAWLCITYTGVAAPFSIYYLVSILLNGGYTAFKLREIRRRGSEIDYSILQPAPTFNDFMALIGGGIYAAFFTFSLEMRQAYWGGLCSIKKRSYKEV